ncbi:SDR family NAD(P)-dependent oxidoreductase [Jeotgalibacillus proteolyticus]|uniref:SDR family NAD(P)-dependent oxidoreductase n=1 Tax=Jeotgalibacillus proteolyticus TaxID=2082395 RepID=UPI003CEA7B0A
MNIMITGATGFVGTKLVKSLLKDGHTLFPLVRSEKKKSAILASLTPEEAKRVHPVYGDVTKEMLGVNAADQKNLLGQLHILYHTAAFLSFDPDDREKTFFVNVQGTKHAIDFAHKIRIPSFFHISTAYTLGLDHYGKETIHSLSRMFVNDYEESKCQAEHLVWQERDALQVSIFRPAIIVGDSNTGEADTTFALYGLLKAVALVKKLIQRGRISSDHVIRLLCNEEASNNVVPVNYVVDVLSAAAVHAEPSAIYHIANNHAPKNKDVMNWIKEISGVTQLELVSTPDRLTESDKVINEPMSVFRSYLSRSVEFDDTNTQNLLKKSGRKELDLTDEKYRMLIKTYFNS